MPKIITLEMLQDMTPEQRKTLHHNASTLDTEAARNVLDLLSQDGLMDRQKTAFKTTAKAAGMTKPKTVSGTKAKTASGKKSIKAVHGRQT